MANKKFEPKSKRPPTDKDSFKSKPIAKPSYKKPDDTGGYPPRVKKS